MIRVIIEDKEIAVSCDHGCWCYDSLNNNYLWILGAVKKLAESGDASDIIEISDLRTDIAPEHNLSTINDS